MHATLCFAVLLGALTARHAAALTVSYTALTGSYSSWLYDRASCEA